MDAVFLDASANLLIHFLRLVFSLKILPASIFTTWLLVRKGGFVAERAYVIFTKYSDNDKVPSSV